MGNNLKVLDFTKIIAKINKAHQANNQFLEEIKENSKKNYYVGFSKILRDQKVKYIENEKEQFFNSDVLTSEHKIAILDSMNIIEEQCTNCNLQYSKPFTPDQFSPECSFCYLVKQYYFNPNGYELIIDTDVVETEAIDTNVEVIWQFTSNNNVQNMQLGYIRNFKRMLETRDKFSLLKHIRRRFIDISDEDIIHLSDQELRSVIYNHDSRETRKKAIANIKSKDVLYSIFHSINDFKEEFITRFYQLGGHSLDIMIFLLPPYVNTGSRYVDMQYNVMKKEFEKDLINQEAKYPYWVETSKKLSIDILNKNEELLEDEEIPTNMDLKFLAEEAKLGNALALIDLWKNKQISLIKSVITDPDSQIPFDIRLMQLIQVIPINEFQFTLDQILDINVSEPSIWAPSLASDMMKKIKDPKLKSKLYNHPHFEIYKQFKEEEKKKSKYLYDQGFR